MFMTEYDDSNDEGKSTYQLSKEIIGKSLEERSLYEYMPFVKDLDREFACDLASESIDIIAATMVANFVDKPRKN
jgi:hypothetical protein